MKMSKVVLFLLIGGLCISSCKTKSDIKSEVRISEPQPSGKITSKYKKIKRVFDSDGYNDYVSNIVDGADSVFKSVRKKPYSSTQQFKKKRLKKVREYVNKNIVERFLLFYESDPEYHSYDPNKETLSLQTKIYSPSIDLMYYDESKRKYEYTIGKNMGGSRIRYLTKDFDGMHKVEQFNREVARSYDVLNRKLGVYMLMESKTAEDMKEEETHVNLTEDGKVEYPIYTESEKWNVKDTSLVVKYIDLKVVSTEIADGDEKIIKVKH